MEVNPLRLKRDNDSENSDEEYEPTKGPGVLHAQDDLKLEEDSDSVTSQIPQQEEQSAVHESQEGSSNHDNSETSQKAIEKPNKAASNTETQVESEHNSHEKVDGASDSNHEHESFVPEELNAHYNDDKEGTSNGQDAAQETDYDNYEPDLEAPGEDKSAEKGNISNVENVKADAQSKDEDDYDPEEEEKLSAPASLPSRPPAGLPPKPLQSAKVVPSTAPISAQGEMAESLRNAYNAYMHSGFANDPSFSELPQSEQVSSIQELLHEREIDLGNVNWDQVYSYNKPFKQLKDPIPLVPVNEFCRRPNITTPSTPEEENEYQEFIERENHYMNLQNWDEFPDKSRLFVGNLPANTISKQDLFRIFTQYGEVIQIAIKAGYGFIQFRSADACLDCVRGETDTPLHNKVLRLDASKPQKSRRPGHPEVNNPNLSSRGRERPSAGDEPEKKKRKGSIDCIVYITGKSSVFFIRKVKKAFARCQISIGTEDVTQKNIADVLSEAAYSGYLGACVIKEHKVDIQTYEEQHNGGIKFDEYAEIDPDEAAEVMAKAKLAKYGSNPPPYHPQDTSYNENANDRGNRQHDHDRNRGNFGRNNKRGKGRHGHANDSRYGHDTYGRHNNNYSQQTWSNPDPYSQFPSQQPQQPQQQQQVYGQVPSGQFSPFAQQQQQQLQGQFSSPYGFQQPQQPVYNQFASAQQQPPLNFNQPNIAQALQSLNANQVQSMINLLQQQQQQQQPPQPGAPPLGSSYPMQNQPQTARVTQPVPSPGPTPAAYGQPPPLNYSDGGRRRGPRGPNYGSSSRPYGNVPQPHQNHSPGINMSQTDTRPNDLLSQLQSRNYSQAGNSQQSSSNSELMETLQRLAKR
ncbi:NAB3 [Candida margitis]|uniref:NAB3 n=1 Tax=Candida margitis TaxID=1775924 RepID=UPI002226E9BD|nr:NAB3 [Candida margitis]KAI5968081.1 NAB3 [Candida margitis]